MSAMCCTNFISLFDYGSFCNVGNLLLENMYRLKKRPNSCALKKSKTQKNIIYDIFRIYFRSLVEAN